MIHTVKGFGIVNKAEVDFFFPAILLIFLWSNGLLAIWSLVPLPFLNRTWSSGISQFMNCWSLAWRILSITLLVCEMSAILWYLNILWHCFSFYGIIEYYSDSFSFSTLMLWFLHYLRLAVRTNLSLKNIMYLIWFLSSLFMMNLGVVFFLFLIILATQILLSMCLLFSSSLESFYPLFKHYFCFAFCIYLNIIWLMLFLFWTPIMCIPYHLKMSHTINALFMFFHSLFSLVYFKEIMIYY